MPIFKETRAKAKEAGYKIYTAGEIRKVALDILKYEYNAEVWKNNNLAVRGRKFIGKEGVADIIGYTRDRGIMVQCENKTVSDTFSDAQIEMLTDLHSCGGLALIAYQDGIHVKVMPFFQWHEKALSRVQSKSVKKR